MQVQVSSWVATVFAWGAAIAGTSPSTYARVVQVGPELAQFPAKPAFSEPVMLLAHDKPMGARRLYPSPVFADMNGDGLADIVLGDLWGKLTTCFREAGDGAARFGPEVPLLARDGSPLDFKNW